MYRQYNKKIKFFSILILFIMFISLSCCLEVNAEPNVEEITWVTTCFKGKELGAKNPKTNKSFTEDDFTVNEKYGWCEYEKDGVKYVVLAGATNELLKSAPNIYPKLDNIYYFNYFDTVSFKLMQNSDSTVYNGIILDSCGASMKRKSRWNSDIRCLF